MSQKLTDLMQSTADENEIKFYFVTKSGSIDDASEDLKYSFKIITDFSSSTENLQWLSEAECLSFDAQTLTKENVFILEEFEGESFDRLSSTKAIVIGPRVLINCQLTNDVAPNISSPIYTLAMKDFIVCLSGIGVEKRAEIHKLVGYMGGLSSNSLIESTTHLVTNTTMSPKYEKAAARNMKIMSENWVFDVWNLSKIDDDSYRTDEFYQKYKFPIFHNLVITSTGITEANKNEIAKLINKNGGTYTGSFRSKVTDILITQPNQKDSEKFKAAVKCRKECLMVDWVKDSVSKGYMLPFVNYRIYTGHATREEVLNSTQATNRTLRTDIFNPDGTLSIKVPDPIATFPKLPPNEYNFTDLRNKIYYISKSSMDDLPPDYWVILQRLFTQLDSCQSVLSENILKQSASTEYKNTAQQLTALATHIDTLKKNIQILLQDGTSDDNQNTAKNEGFSSCQEIIRCFSDENGSFYRNSFLSCPCLVISAGIIHSFSKLWLTDDQKDELRKVVTPVLLCFKDKCIEERLDNIKMLRTQSVSYNVHDYSYEAQVRKDVTFAGKINDFYDKRPTEEISFRDHPLKEVTDADHILAGYKAEVRREYEQLFGVLLNDF